MISSTRYRVAPGKMQDFENLVKTDVLPALQKMKSGVTISRRGMGANPNDVVATSPIANYAEFDAPSPLERALGAEGMAKLQSKAVGILTPIETLVRTRVADLSF
jgi:hypothetical protein